MAENKANRGWGNSRPLKPRKQIKFYVYEENYPILDAITGNRNEWINEAIKFYDKCLKEKSR